MTFRLCLNFRQRISAGFWLLVWKIKIQKPAEIRCRKFKHSRKVTAQSALEFQSLFEGRLCYRKILFNCRDQYHGEVLIPEEYPMKGPDIIFHTENGRFKTHTPICLSNTSYHPESWTPLFTLFGCFRGPTVLWLFDCVWIFDNESLQVVVFS